jgi:hypothetical protein
MQTYKELINKHTIQIFYGYTNWLKFLLQLNALLYDAFTGRKCLFTWHSSVMQGAQMLQICLLH